MIETIRQILAQTECDGYEITDTRTNGWEFYFIRHRLDQNRAKLVEDINVKVYKKSADGKFLGSASGEISPTASKEEAERMIIQLAQTAGLVENPVYALNPKAQLTEQKSGLSEQNRQKTDLAEIAAAYISAMEAADETPDGDLNSYEIFVNEITRRYVNSAGTDETFTYPSSMAEVVVNARRDGHEIELYRMYTSGTCDRETLLKDVNETIAYGRDKLQAKDTPALGKADVVFSTDAALEIYSYFISRLNAAYKVRRISDWEIGVPLFADGTGDQVTIHALAALPNSSRNYPLDAEGAVIKDTCLLEKNTPRQFWGSRQFCQYLGLEDTSLFYNFSVDGGSCGIDEIRSGDYLEIVEFSDFQVNPMTGAIAGEIRLGYLHQGGKTEIVSGGSVSGSMRDFAKTMRFSRETRQYDHMRIPSATRLKDVSITGIDGSEDR